MKKQNNNIRVNVGENKLLSHAINDYQQYKAMIQMITAGKVRGPRRKNKQWKLSY